MLGLVAEVEPVEGFAGVVGFTVTDGLFVELDEPDATRPTAPDDVRPAGPVVGREAEDEPED